ncbi:hypothetical protein GCM10022393_39490 [Aquimarina addita]|uniref:Nucleotide-binding universal stress UspA family protein n=1 Tax=Aquimarina addita TaxID=870485 RepID=A0ABP6USS9_9FLAO
MINVLIPMDYSENANNALAYARILFSSTPCTFYILHIFVSHPSNLITDKNTDDFFLDMIKEKETELKKFIKPIQENNTISQHHFKPIIKATTVLKAISNVIDTKSIHFLAMGTKGGKSNQEIFLGTHATRILNDIKTCALVLVPKSYMSKAPSQIVFSTNFKRDFKEKEFLLYKTLLQLTGSKLKVVQVMEEEYLSDIQKVNKEHLKKLFVGIDYFFHKITIETSESNAIRDFVLQTQSDLITFINHKYSFLQKLLEEDVVKNISFHSPVPILLLPEIE